MSTETYRPTIALGGGHANLHALRRTGELTRRGFDGVLVERGVPRHLRPAH